MSLFGFIGKAIGGVLGVSKPKTNSTADYDRFLQRQEQRQIEHEQKMAMLQMQAQKKTGVTISPLIIFGGVAVVAMIFLPQMMGRR